VTTENQTPDDEPSFTSWKVVFVPTVVQGARSGKISYYNFAKPHTYDEAMEYLERTGDLKNRAVKALEPLG
jgi:hypothetical protein